MGDKPGQQEGQSIILFFANNSLIKCSYVLDYYQTDEPILQFLMILYLYSFLLWYWHCNLRRWFGYKVLKGAYLILYYTSYKLWRYLKNNIKTFNEN